MINQQGLEQLHNTWLEERTRPLHFVYSFQKNRPSMSPHNKRVKLDVKHHSVTFSPLPHIDTNIPQHTCALLATPVGPLSVLCKKTELPQKDLHQAGMYGISGPAIRWLAVGGGKLCNLFLGFLLLHCLVFVLTLILASLHASLVCTSPGLPSAMPRCIGARLRRWRCQRPPLSSADHISSPCSTSWEINLLEGRCQEAQNCQNHGKHIGFHPQTSGF